MKKCFKAAISILALSGAMLVSGCSSGSDDPVSTPTGGNKPSKPVVPVIPEIPEIEEIVLSTEIDDVPAEITVNSGETKDVELKVISLAASKTFKMEGEATWAIDDPYIASIVADTGFLTPLSGGTATVTGTLKSDTSKKATIRITIPEPNREVTQDPFDLSTISEAIDVYCCGDSIMRDYGATEDDQYGLGQALKVFFDESKANVVTDISNGGRSSRLFYNEASRWPEVKKRILQGKALGRKSVVILSFGHNDQRALTDVNKDYGAQFTFAKENQNGTIAGTHYDFMEKYIVESRELGAVPVLLTPFVRAYFDSEGKITETGYNDWTNKTMTGGDTKPRGNYPQAMIDAAEKHGAILVDMAKLSGKVVEAYNAAGKIKYFYVDSDTTHERTLGGLELAKLVTDDLKEKGVLTSYIKETQPRVMISRSSLAFGRLLANVSKDLSFKISNFRNTSGKVTITVPAGYGVSLSAAGEYTSSVEVETTADFIGCDVFVRFTPTEVTSYNGNITVTHTSVTPDFGNTPAGEIEGSTLKIALTGAGKDKSVTGSDVSVLWPMVNEGASALSDVAAVTGSEDLAPANVKLVGLVASTLKNGNARVTIDNTGSVWPVNDTGAKLNDVYLEYAIPVKGVNLTVNKISFQCCASGGSYMAWSAYYSTNEDFSNPDPICTNVCPGVKDTLKTESVGDAKGTDNALGLSVDDGQTLYIRIYPAYKDTKENSGRQFTIANVKVEGLLN